jgi:predicted nucleic acid-binding protein
MKLVVDASVAAKWVVVEPLSDRATSLLQADHQLLVPDLFWAEIGNIFWKKARRGDLTNADCVRRFDALHEMGLETRAHAPIARDAIAIALENARTVYDSIYVALAVHENCRL